MYFTLQLVFLPSHIACVFSEFRYSPNTLPNLSIGAQSFQIIIYLLCLLVVCRLQTVVLCSVPFISTPFMLTFSRIIMANISTLKQIRWNWVSLSTPAHYRKPLHRLTIDYNSRQYCCIMCLSIDTCHHQIHKRSKLCQSKESNAFSKSRHKKMAGSCFASSEFIISYIHLMSSPVYLFWIKPVWSLLIRPGKKLFF